MIVDNKRGKQYFFIREGVNYVLLFRLFFDKLKLRTWAIRPHLY